MGLGVVMRFFAGLGGLGKIVIMYFLGFMLVLYDIMKLCWGLGC